MLLLVLRWGESAAGRVQSCVVEPVDPFQRGQLDVGERFPGPFAADLLGLEEADRGLGEGVEAPIVVKYDVGSGSWGRRRS